MGTVTNSWYSNKIDIHRLNSLRSVARSIRNSLAVGLSSETLTQKPSRSTYHPLEAKNVQTSTACDGDLQQIRILVSTYYLLIVEYFELGRRYLLFLNIHSFICRSIFKANSSNATDSTMIPGRESAPSLTTFWSRNESILLESVMVKHPCVERCRIDRLCELVHWQPRVVGWVYPLVNDQILQISPLHCRHNRSS